MSASFLDPNPPRRTAVEWRDCLEELVLELSDFTSVQLATSWWRVQDDAPGAASASNCVDVRGKLSETFDITVCGVLCVTVNFGEVVSISCDLLLFVRGKRVTVSDGAVIFLRRDHDGWRNLGWCVDESGEWELHEDESRWLES